MHFKKGFAVVGGQRHIASLKSVYSQICHILLSSERHMSQEQWTYNANSWESESRVDWLQTRCEDMMAGKEICPGTESLIRLINDRSVSWRKPAIDGT